MRTSGWSFVMGAGVATTLWGLGALGAYSAGYSFTQETAATPCPAQECPAVEVAQEEPATDCDADDEDDADDETVDFECPAPGSVAPQQALKARRALDNGNHNILLGKFDEAVDQGALALTLDPSQAEAHKLLGVAYARLNDYCEAKLHYQMYLACRPDSSQADRIRQIMNGPELSECPDLGE